MMKRNPEMCRVSLAAVLVTCLCASAPIQAQQPAADPSQPADSESQGDTTQPAEPGATEPGSPAETPLPEGESAAGPEPLQTIPVGTDDQAPPPPAATELETIEVTARKRSETLQDVPISMSALGQKTLGEMGVQDQDDYIHFMPGVSITDLGPGNKRVSVRGVSASAFSSPNLQATVAQYIDEMIISDTRGAQLDLRMFDVKRVELLRGPQGTLYGAGSMGGALRIITNQPDPRGFASALDSTVSSTAGGGQNYSADGMLNIPITDSLAVRATGYYRDDEGFIDAPNLGAENINTNKTQGGRLAIRYVPLDNLVVSANVLTQKMDLGMADWLYSKDVDDLTSLIHKAEAQNDKFTLANLTLDYNFGWAGLTSATSYVDGHRFLLLSFEEVIDASVRATFPGTGPFDNTSQVSIPYNDDRIITQEIRLVSQGSWDIDWLAGLYFQRADNAVFADTVCPECYTDDRTSAAFASLDARPMLRPVILREIADKEIKQDAVFGEATYYFMDDWAATGGLRVFRAEFSRDLWQDGAFYQLLNPDATGPAISSTTTSENVVNPKFQIQYNVSPDVLLLAVASKGYRVGGVNPLDPGAEPGTVPTDFKSDSLWNYELTGKTQWLDRTLTLNASVYTIKWSDIQTPALSPSGFGIVVNGGRATVIGSELEASIQPLDRLDLRGTLSWTKPQFDEDVPALGAKAGDPLPAVPEWSGSASVQYGFPLFGAVAKPRIDYHYVGESFEASAGGQPVQNLRIGDYGITNARVALEMGAWEASTFVNNLGDERAVLATSPILTQRTVTTMPRTIGLTVKLSF